MKQLLAVISVAALCACNPPAAGEVDERDTTEAAGLGPLAPLASPDTQDAVWGTGTGERRLIYGNPGQPPLISLACENFNTDKAVVRIVRYVPGQSGAKALFALVGNGTVSRLKMDSRWTGKGWQWESAVDPASPDLDVLTGIRSVEATLPGGGSVILNPSQAPRDLINQCRSGIIPPAEADEILEEEQFLVEDGLPD
ncbi:hypothetical protein [Altererythrobacter aquiaggeris]|uniref:hypothetical protein n=1 Tax=Aestuarierythrobacter aquiaggeris TaxID=1898396 RepID=UPI00301A5CB1